MRAVVLCLLLLPSSNRDPNYLSGGDLEDSPWYATVASLRERCLEVAAIAAATASTTTIEPTASEPAAASTAAAIAVLFDCHGARDGDGIDLYVGLRAMERSGSDALVHLG